MSAHTRRYKKTTDRKSRRFTDHGLELTHQFSSECGSDPWHRGDRSAKDLEEHVIASFLIGLAISSSIFRRFDVHLRSLEDMTGGPKLCLYRSSLGHLHTGGISLSRDPKPPSCQQSRDRPLTNSGCSVASINCETSASTVARYLAGPSLISFDNYRQLLLYRLSTYLLNSILKRSGVPMIFRNDIH